MLRPAPPLCLTPPGLPPSTQSSVSCSSNRSQWSQNIRLGTYIGGLREREVWDICCRIKPAFSLQSCLNHDQTIYGYDMDSERSGLFYWHVKWKYYLTWRILTWYQGSRSCCWDYQSLQSSCWAETVTCALTPSPCSARVRNLLSICDPKFKPF